MTPAAAKRPELAPEKTRDLVGILRAGRCTRWHANPDMAHHRETLAEHQAMVAQIILALHPAPSLTLVDAALHHDIGEAELGDLPGPAKRAHPELAAILEAAEKQARARMMGGWPRLTRDEADWLAFADRLAALVHLAHVQPTHVWRPDWHQDRMQVIALGASLGVDVSGFLSRMGWPG